ncbi:MAG: uncharacterized protein A8A55_0891 [Amphiamblys sp. WSBS2006]|nr:MAG: uncharacterized protein A8A55_0891 [Amphiamblys sp. WSBS2006]
MRRWPAIHHYTESGEPVTAAEAEETHENNTRKYLAKAKEEIDVLYNLFGIIESQTGLLETRKVEKKPPAKETTHTACFRDAADKVDAFIRKRF